MRFGAMKTIRAALIGDFDPAKAAHQAIPKALELANHPFFFATLFQPERSALRNESHPLLTALVAAPVPELAH